jgi:hypothetical protein
LRTGEGKKASSWCGNGRRIERFAQGSHNRSRPRPLQQLRELGDVEGDPARCVPRQQSGSGASAGFNFVIAIGQRLPVVVADDEARRGF